MEDGFNQESKVGILLFLVFLWAIFEGHPWVALFIFIGCIN